uniref:Secreted protein n=1 Tax=Strongyloides venezuelensis TaxID=75913 RepID=A0A0K0EZH9_STRVS
MQNTRRESWWALVNQLPGGLGWGGSACRVNICLPVVVDRVSVPSVASIDHQWGSPLVIGRSQFTGL